MTFTAVSFLMTAAMLPNGTALCWLQWGRRGNHPRMRWLYVDVLQLVPYAGWSKIGITDLTDLKLGFQIGKVAKLV